MSINFQDVTNSIQKLRMAQSRKRNVSALQKKMDAGRLSNLEKRLNDTLGETPQPHTLLSRIERGCK